MGRHIAALSVSGLRMGLEGTLGAGKTTLVRGIAEGMQPGLERAVSSPTYALWQTYGEGALHHLDLYRIEGEGDLEPLGFLDHWHRGIWIIEWASRVESVLQALDVVLVVEVKGSGRCVEAISLSPTGDDVVDVLQGRT